MKFKFRKIASVLASAVMIGSTIGIAAAASYPTPFVSSAGGDVAVVVGSASGVATSDFIAAADLGTNLQAELAKLTATSGTTGTGSVTGEAVALFTGGSKIYLNDTLNYVKTTITKSDMPIVLKDGAFSGNVDATYTETITLGTSPQVLFGKVPTSSDDPSFALSYSSGVVYSATTTFNKAVNFTHADSKNQELILFGKKFTVGSATTTTDLVLLKEATSLNFDSTGTTSQEVTIGGKVYTVELVSASTTTATVKVTNDAGASEQKEITEGGNPKKVNGLSIAVNTADTNNLKYTASVVAGSEKITLTDDQVVTYGESNTQLDGTLVDFNGAASTGVLTKLTINVSAPESDKDAIKAGEKLLDPLFGTFAVDFTGLNVPEDSTARELITIKPSGDDKMTLDVTDARGNAKTGLQWAMNLTDKIYLQHDSSGHNITLAERAVIKTNEMAVVGNEDEGRLIQITSIVNKTGDNSDTVTWKDVFTGETQTVTATSEAAGDITIGGKVYTFAITPAASTTASEARSIRLQYPDSASTDMIIYPTIQTSKGAKLMFYNPLTIALDNWDGAGGDVGNIRIPNGADAYQSVAITFPANTIGNYTVEGTGISNAAGLNASVPVTITSTGLKFNFTSANVANQTVVYLVDPKNKVNIVDPAIVVLEEKDDNNRYEAVIVTLSAGTSSTTSLKVSDAIRTWEADSVWNNLDTAADSDIDKEADLFGTIITQDSSSTQDKFAIISYPDEQAYAQLYISKSDATITAATATGGTVTELGNVIVKDSEIAQVQSKNLIVVGGSCINSAAQKVLGETAALCGAAFTTKTGVGVDQALIKVVKNPYLAADTTKIAMLVAGYEAADTTKAVKYATTSKPSTAVGEIKLSTSSTVATTI